MNRFEKLLHTLVLKIENVRALCADIPTHFAEEIVINLGRVVNILRDPQGVTNGRNVGYVAAEAEQAIQDLIALERRFLVTFGTIQSFRDRIGALHSDTPSRMRVSDAITEYDELRLNHETRTSILREKYEFLQELMAKAEKQSRDLNSRNAYERVRDTLSGIVGSIKPVKRGRDILKRQADADIRSSMRGNTNGGGKSRKRA